MKRELWVHLSRATINPSKSRMWLARNQRACDAPGIASICGFL